MGIFIWIMVGVGFYRLADYEQFERPWVWALQAMAAWFGGGVLCGILELGEIWQFILPPFMLVLLYISMQISKARRRREQLRDTAPGARRRPRN